MEEARPAHCSLCGVGAREGGLLWLYGHGLVSRQQRGPATPGEPPTCAEIFVRRYLCRRCATVIRVVPASCVPGKHFSGAAIALALALWGCTGQSAAEVREQVNDWRVRGAAARGWRALRRWATEVGAGVLAGSAREVARRAAQALAGHAPLAWRSAPVEHQAQLGYCHVT